MPKLVVDLDSLGDRFWGHAEPGIVGEADVIVVPLEYRVSLLPVSLAEWKRKLVTY